VNGVAFALREGTDSAFIDFDLEQENFSEMWEIGTKGCMWSKFYYQLETPELLSSGKKHKPAFGGKTIVT
jgi:hypothetical protein